MIDGMRLPMSVEAYLELGETDERIELFDGSLYLSARGHPRHQFILGRIMNALRAGAAASGWHLLGPVNLRLGLRRIANPDMVVTRAVNLDDQLVDSCAAVIVAEVASQSDEVSRVLKRHYYATAGIPWYLLVEQESATLHLHQLRGNHYVERSVTRPGEVLHLEEPLTADLAPVDLLPPDEEPVAQSAEPSGACGAPEVVESVNLTTCTCRSSAGGGS